MIPDGARSWLLSIAPAIRAAVVEVGDQVPSPAVVAIHPERDPDYLPAALEHHVRHELTLEVHALAGARGLAQLVCPGVAAALDEPAGPGAIWVLAIGPSGAGVVPVRVRDLV